MTLIADSDSLSRLCQELATADFVTVDTEFIRERTFWSQLCLVQIAGPGGAWAIDPLAPGIDLTPLVDLMNDGRVLKVFHAARQDIEIFYRLAGKVPAPLFDTQVAAMVCGFGDAASYETLAAQLTGARIDKSMRFTDWASRPLTDRQTAYALADVIHLRPIYLALAKRIVAAGRVSWVEEEMQQLIDPATYRFEPAEAWRRFKPRTLKPRILGVLMAIAEWREREAQKRDLPRGRLLRDETVLDIAAHAPKSITDLSRARGLNKGFAEGRLGQDLLDAVAAGLAVPPDRLPQLEPPPDLPRGLGPVVELLKVLLRLKSEEFDVASKLIATAEDLDRIAADDDADVPALRGWRREVFGEAALAIKHGKLALIMKGRRVELVPAP